VLAKGPGEPRLKRPAGRDESGCRLDYIVDGFVCRNASIDAFVAALQAGPATTRPVMNQTGIDGTWDFDVTGVELPRKRGVSEGNPILSSVATQLGLTLELRPVPQPVVVVERVNRAPTGNVPDIATQLPPDPDSFEVASIRPCRFVNPLDAGGATGQQTSPSGQITTGCLPLTMHIATAWDLGVDTRAMGNTILRASGPGAIAGTPRSLEGNYYNIVAKSPIPLGVGAPLVRDVRYQAMLRNLLIERFRMVTHYEDRVVDVLALVAAKPTFNRANPSSRSGCRSTGLAFGVPTIVTCQNVTMAQFADALNSEFTIAAGGSRGRRIVDGTGLEGKWDLSFRYRTMPAAASVAGQAAEPTGDLPALQAIQQQLGLRVVDQKRSMPVFVIDRIDEHPIEN
jgi:uncharacterized protein (TIGR03435 family)